MADIIIIKNKCGLLRCRAKSKGLSLEEAMDLVLVEAIIANKCATIFEPKYKHTVQNGKVLGILIYGHPARYKNKQ